MGIQKPEDLFRVAREYREGSIFDHFSLRQPGHVPLHFQTTPIWNTKEKRVVAVGVNLAEIITYLGDLMDDRELKLFPEVICSLGSLLHGIYGDIEMILEHVQSPDAGAMINKTQTLLKDIPFDIVEKTETELTLNVEEVGCEIVNSHLTQRMVDAVTNAIWESQFWQRHGVTASSMLTHTEVKYAVNRLHTVVAGILSYGAPHPDYVPERSAKLTAMIREVLLEGMNKLVGSMEFGNLVMYSLRQEYLSNLPEDVREHYAKHPGLVSAQDTNLTEEDLQIFKGVVPQWLFDLSNKTYGLCTPFELLTEYVGHFINHYKGHARDIKFYYSADGFKDITDIEVHMQIAIAIRKALEVKL